MPPLKVATFGLKGVNVVDSPLHVSDDDLLTGQNAEIFQEEGMPAIRKRLGMVAGMASAMDGSVYSVISVPLTDPSPSAGAATDLVLFYDPKTAGGNEVNESSDGGSWSGATLAGVVTPPTRIVSQEVPLYTPASAFLLYPSLASNVISAFQWNQAPTDAKYVDNIITNYPTLDLVAWSKKAASIYLWVIELNTSGGLMKLKRVDLDAVSVAEWSDTYGGAGDYPNEYSWDCIEFNDQVYIATTELSGGFNVSRKRKVSATSDVATSVDNTITASAVNHIANWAFLAGNSYLLAGGVGQDGSAEARLLRCDLSSTWTEVYRSSAGFNTVAPAYSEGEELFLFEHDPFLAELKLYRSTNGGSSWSAVVTRSSVTVMPYITPLIKLGVSYYWAESADLNSDIKVQRFTIGGGETTVFTRSFSVGHSAPLLGAFRL